MLNTLNSRMETVSRNIKCVFSFLSLDLMQLKYESQNLMRCRFLSQNPMCLEYFLRIWGGGGG